MSSIDPTTQALRLAMAMSLANAEVASSNIASATKPGATARVADFSSSLALLAQAAGAHSSDHRVGQALADATAIVRDAPLRDIGSAINLDEQVADMASSSGRYQTLSESLGRHLGLMRLAITGR
jgi:flagellar basal body rod protein FlgB